MMTMRPVPIPVPVAVPVAVALPVPARQPVQVLDLVKPQADGKLATW